MICQQTGLLLQETNVLGFKGPRKMTVLIPGMNTNGERIELKPRTVSQIIDDYNNLIITLL